VTVNYTAYLVNADGNNGAVVEQKENFQFVVGAEEVVLGVDLGVQSMKKTEKAFLTIKPSYAYGDHGNSTLNVPAHAVLRYEVELVEYEKEKDSWDMNFEEKVEMAEKKRLDGNVLFQQGKYVRAIKKYKRVLDFFEHDSNLKEDQKQQAKKLKSPCYLNTAACLIKQLKYTKAIENCTKAIESDYSNLKAWFRRGQCYLELDEYDLAQKDLEKAQEFDTDGKNAKDIKKELLRLKKKRQEQDEKDKSFYTSIFQK